MNTLARRQRAPYRSERHHALDTEYPSEFQSTQFATLDEAPPLFDKSPIASRVIGVAIAIAVGFIAYLLLSGQ